MTELHRRLACGALITLVALLAACSSIRTVHDADPDADFTRYHSWAWITEDALIRVQPGAAPVSYVSPIDEQRIRSAVEAVLAAKGYQKLDAERADLIVSFSVGTEEKTRIYTTPTGGMYGGGYGYGGWYGGSEVRSVQYTEGTLTLQIFDRVERRAVWVGWGSKRLSRGDDSDKVVREAVVKILEPFPAAR